MATPKPWYLYLIECADGSIYTGIAVDVAARYAAHAEGRGARYTRSHPPLRLLLVEAHADRSSAAKAECAMKKRRAADKWAYVERRRAAGAEGAEPDRIQATARSCASHLTIVA